jgi:hypothetical protein
LIGMTGAVSHSRGASASSSDAASAVRLLLARVLLMTRMVENDIVVFFVDKMKQTKGDVSAINNRGRNTV